MAGCRSLTKQEQDSVVNKLSNQRDKTLFILGLYCGFRISELLSLRLKDVWADGGVLSRIRLERRFTKGKAQSRDVVLHPVAQEAIQGLVLLLRNEPDSFLFQSRNHGKALSRCQAHTILKTAYAAAGVTGHVATHSMRKSFATAVYKRSNHDILLTQKALGHASLVNTVKYLSADQSAVDAAILAS
jgi:integrase